MVEWCTAGVLGFAAAVPLSYVAGRLAEKGDATAAPGARTVGSVGEKGWLLGALLFAAVCVSVVWRYGVGAVTCELLCFSAALFVLSLTDLAARVIPNECLLFAVAARVIYVLANEGLPGLVAPLVSAVAVGGMLLAFSVLAEKLLRRQGVGGGDVKLFAVSALYFGWRQAVLVIVLACVLGIVFGVATASREAKPEQKRRTVAFPWGPSIAISCWVVMLSGEQILGLLGGMP